MALINPTLQTATGSTVQISVLTTGTSNPPQVKFVVSTAAKDATSLAVTTTMPAGTTTFSLKNGTYILAIGAATQIVVVDGDQTITAASTSITIDPLSVAISASTTLRTYVGAMPVVGLEAANMQLQKEVNSATLLVTKGWQSKSYSTGSWQISGTLYSSTNSTDATAERTLVDALIKEQFVYVERFLSDGSYLAGVGVVSDASDTVQGSSFIQKSLTIQGSGKPVTTPLSIT